MDISQHRVLITGGAGFIGSHLAESLLDRGVYLSIVDNFDSFYSRRDKERNLAEVGHRGKFRLFDADIRDQDALHLIFSSVRPTLVVHLAALAGVRQSIQNPIPYQDVNVKGTLVVLEMCRRLQVARLIFGSSSSVYGENAFVPLSESNTDLRPISPYAATKQNGETMCYTYAYLYGLSVLCLRFFTVYGSRQRPDLAISKFASLIDHGRPVPIFGDGTSSRDYTHVTDIVSGILAAAEYEASGKLGVEFDIFNLGSGHPVSLNDLVHYLEEALGKSAVIESQPIPVGEVRMTWANLDKAKQLLRFDPKIRIGPGLKSFVTWYRRERS